MGNDGRKRRIMKTAFSLWQGRIAPVFDVSRRLLILETKEGREMPRLEELMSGDAPLEKSASLVSRGVDTLVCGAISRYLRGAITAAGIRVIPFVSGPVEEVVEAWEQGRIAEDSFTMPGCCGNRARRQHGTFHDLSAKTGTYERAGFGVGRGGRFDRDGGSGNCLCPGCGYVMPHELGRPCAGTLCPRCGSVMVRQ
jgi:predicted Fe-Mo cluster-binding NifX family protein